MSLPAATRTVRLDVAEGLSVTAKIDAPTQLGPKIPGMVLAHGLSNTLDYPFLASLASYLAQEGVALVLRFNFPYAERGAKHPDSRSVLENTFRRAYDLLVQELLEPGAPIFLAGKSLGGRFATEFASGTAEGGSLPASGLVVLGYPLHAPGRTDRLYTKPLEHLHIPSLFCLGTRDPYCEPELLAPLLATLPYPGRLFVVEGGDHSFLLPKSSGRPPTDAYPDINRTVAAFVHEISSNVGQTGAP